MSEPAIIHNSDRSRSEVHVAGRWPGPGSEVMT
jgi:hypothetical protein